MRNIESFVAILRTTICGLCLFATTACDDGGTDLLRAPELQSKNAPEAYGVNQPLNTNFLNFGGAPTECSLSVGQTLPVGLMVGLSSNRLTCAISGTPSATKIATLYTITATNSLGSSSATINLAILDQAVMPTCVAGASPAARRAQYRVTFTSNWSVANNGGTLPGGAHWSPLIGATHNDQYAMWQPVSSASNGIEQMSETGGTSTLNAEFRARILATTVGEIISGGGLSSAAGSVSTSFTATCDHPLVSVTSMLAPSPDWFIGVHDLSLIDSSKEWRDTVEQVLYVYDAGTDSGQRFNSANADITPHIPIKRLVGNGIIGFTPGRDAVGKMTFSRLTQ